MVPAVPIEATMIQVGSFSKVQTTENAIRTEERREETIMPIFRILFFSSTTLSLWRWTASSYANQREGSTPFGAFLEGPFTGRRGG